MRPSRRSTAGLWAALVVAAVLAPVAVGAAEPPAPGLAPPDGQARVKPIDEVTFGGAVDPGATLVAGALVFHDGDRRLDDEIDVMDPDASESRRLKADEQGRLSGSWKLAEPIVPGEADTITLEVTVDQPDGTRETGWSTPLEIDRVRPFVERATLTARDVVVVHFNETVLYPHDDEDPTAWLVDGARRVLRVDGEGAERTLTLTERLDQDATPDVALRPLDGTVSPIHHDEAGWDLAPGEGRTATALDGVAPAVPDLTEIAGQPADEPVLGRDTAPTVRVEHDRAGHTVRVHRESDGVEGLSEEDDEVGSGEVAAHDDGTYAEFTVSVMREGDNVLYAVAVDPSGNVSEGADRAVYDLDTGAPRLVDPATAGSTSVTVLFTEAVTGPDDPADWTVGGPDGPGPAVTGVSGSDDRRRLTTDGPVPAGATLTYDAAGEPYVDRHGNALVAERIGIVAADLPVLDVVGGEVEEDDPAALPPIDPTPELAFTVSLSEPVAEGEEVHVSYATEPGTAAADDDYRPQQGTITFEPGQDRATVLVEVVPDRLDEHDETVALVLTDVRGATFPGGADRATADGTIVDDDPLVALTLSDAEVDEGSAATVEVTLDEVSGKDVTLTWEPRAGTAEPDRDFDPEGGRVTIPAGETRGEIQVATYEDGVEEGDEDLTVVLTDVEHAEAERTEATVTLLDADVPLPTVTLAGGDADEGDGALLELPSDLTFTVELSRPVDAGDEVRIDYRTEPRTAGEDDFEATSGTLVLDEGEDTAEVAVRLVGDELDEFDEEVRLVLSNPRGVRFPGGAAELAADGTIVDDDPLVAVSAVDAEVDEGATALVDVELDRASGKDVTVTWETRADTADHGEDLPASTGELTIPAGDTRGTVEVPTRADDRDEDDETFQVAVTEVAHGEIERAVATVTILDAGAGLPTVSVPATSVTEGDGGLLVRPERLSFVVELSRAADEDVTFDYVTEPGTATGSDDYTPASGSATIPAGERSATIEVTVQPDTLDEFDETVLLRLSGLGGARFPGGASTLRATGTILDDDAAPTTILTDVIVGEGADAVVDLTLSGPSGKPIRVDWTLRSGSAIVGEDVPAVTRSASIAPGETRARLRVPTTQDDLDEPDETFDLAITRGHNVVVRDDLAAVTIADDDAPVPIRILDAYATEGDVGYRMAEVRVRLLKESGQHVTVRYATRDRSAVEGEDYVATSGTLDFPPGTVERSFQVRILGDDVAEPTEYLETVLHDVEHADVWRSPAIVGIYDDDGDGTGQAESDTGDDGTVGASGGASGGGASGGVSTGGPVAPAVPDLDVTAPTAEGALPEQRTGAAGDTVQGTDAAGPGGAPGGDATAVLGAPAGSDGVPELPRTGGGAALLGLLGLLVAGLLGRGRRDGALD